MAQAIIRGTPAFAGWPGVADEVVTIVKPRANELPLPSSQWVIVQYADGGRACYHESRLVQQ